MKHPKLLPLLAATAVVALAALYATTGSAALIYNENGGMVVGEGEMYSSRNARPSNGTTYRVVPSESAGAGGLFSGARGGQYVQALPDGGGNDGPTGTPSIEYAMSIQTLGTYRLFLRWDGLDGASDSIYADIVELKDGTGGVIADWYEFQHGVDKNFATAPWDGTGGFEQNAAGITGTAANWSITTPGVYTLRISTREDGAAVDAFVFQLSSLAAPTGTGPPVPEPSTVVMLAGLGIVGLLGHLRRRRRS